MGSTDVPLIFGEIPVSWDDLDNMENGIKKDPEAVAVETLSFKKPAAVARSAQEHKLKFRYGSCLKILFIVLGFLSVIVSTALIIVTILTGIATRAYDADQSSRIAAMVLLAVTAAATICMVIYLEVAIFKKHARPMIVAAAVISILIIVQGLIGGISVKVQPSDEAKLLKSLANSFALSKEDYSRHYKMWSMTQYDLNCCGLHGPDDYMTSRSPFNFPPDVPISCCPNYDPSRSDLVQERERELCKSKRTYYSNGCNDLVVLVFNETAVVVLTVDIILIITEIVLLLVGFLLNRSLGKENKDAALPK